MSKEAPDAIRPPASSRGGKRLLPLDFLLERGLKLEGNGREAPRDRGSKR